MHMEQVDGAHYRGLAESTVKVDTFASDAP
jgi:hypothetical protein